ncbi:MAG: hypothetical protein IPG04_30590 [Polyangiaceae bacterium]|jgi:mRNA-degrading endonuclease RelE of RelBE toxin-antitoxin system|nr:hypothetical protein [Polyangiaceae bacterium]
MPHEDAPPSRQPQAPDDAVRARQVAVLFRLMKHLRAGGSPLPTDLFVGIVEELELRADEASVREAWDEDHDPPSRMFVAGPDAETVASAELSPMARRDLAALTPAEQRLVRARVEELARDPAPRGVQPLGDPRGHLRVRAGRARILYAVRAGVVVLVRVTTGP